MTFNNPELYQDRLYPTADNHPNSDNPINALDCDLSDLQLSDYHNLKYLLLPKQIDRLAQDIHLLKDAIETADDQPAKPLKHKLKATIKHHKQLQRDLKADIANRPFETSIDQRTLKRDLVKKFVQTIKSHSETHDIYFYTSTFKRSFKPQPYIAYEEYFTFLRMHLDSILAPNQQYMNRPILFMFAERKPILHYHGILLIHKSKADKFVQSCVSSIIPEYVEKLKEHRLLYQMKPAIINPYSQEQEVQHATNITASKHDYIRSLQVDAKQRKTVSKTIIDDDCLEYDKNISLGLDPIMKTITLKPKLDNFNTEKDAKIYLKEVAKAKVFIRPLLYLESDKLYRIPDDADEIDRVCNYCTSEFIYDDKLTCEHMIYSSKEETLKYKQKMIRDIYELLNDIKTSKIYQIKFKITLMFQFLIAIEPLLHEIDAKQQQHQVITVQIAKQKSDEEFLKENDVLK